MLDLPPGLHPLSDYVRDRQAMSREQFLAAHPTPVLIVPVVAPLQDAERFSTRKLPVGSAATPFEGVSKLHGQFILRPGGGLELLDTNSANGTFLDGERLQDNAPREVHDGAKIQMGVLEMVYRTPEGLWTELASWPKGGPL